MRIAGSHTPDGESVALMNIRHDQHLTHQSRQAGCIDRLVHRQIGKAIMENVS